MTIHDIFLSRNNVFDMILVRATPLANVFVYMSIVSMCMTEFRTLEKSEIAIML